MPLLTAGPSRFLGRGGVAWLLRDEFTTDLAAGAVNGTVAEPGPGTRTVTDTSGVISVAGGVLVANGTPAALSNVSYGLWTRTAGRILIIKNPTRTTIGAEGCVRFGFGPSVDISTNAFEFDLASATEYRVKNAGGALARVSFTGTLSSATIMRATGVFLLTRIASGNWLLEFVSHATTSNLYARVYFTATSQNVTFDSPRIPDILWLPTPLVSDSFATAFGTSDGLGHAEGIATGIGAGGGGVTWTGATWSVSGGKAINTPVTLGSELIVNGGMETGDPPSSWTGTNATIDGVADERTGGAGAQSLEMTATATGEPRAANTSMTLVVGGWYRLSGWMKSTVGAGAIAIRVRDNSIGGVGVELQSTATSWASLSGSMCADYASNACWTMFKAAAISDKAQFDDVTLKRLTLSELISSISATTANIVVGVNVTLNPFMQSGVCLNLDSAAAPANFVLVTLWRSSATSTSIVVRKYVAGAMSVVASTGVTYSAGARLVVTKDGTAYRVYYNNVLVGTEQTIADAGIVSNTLHGLFSTDAGNTLDDFVVYARGNEGQYANLDRYSSS